MSVVQVMMMMMKTAIVMSFDSDRPFALVDHSSLL